MAKVSVRQMRDAASVPVMSITEALGVCPEIAPTAPILFTEITDLTWKVDRSYWPISRTTHLSAHAHLRRMDKKICAKFRKAFVKPIRMSYALGARDMEGFLSRKTVIANQAQESCNCILKPSQ